MGGYSLCNSCSHRNDCLFYSRNKRSMDGVLNCNSYKPIMSLIKDSQIEITDNIEIKKETSPSRKYSKKYKKRR